MLYTDCPGGRTAAIARHVRNYLLTYVATTTAATVMKSPRSLRLPGNSIRLRLPVTGGGGSKMEAHVSKTQRPN